MSENLKKLREREKKRKVASPTILGKPWRTPKEFATKTAEELERKAEEARKEEQRVKEELAKEQKKITEFIKDELKISADHEFRDIIRYDHIADLMESLGWTSETKVIREIANDERRHKNELERISSYPVLKYLKT
jgi:hypothetical protein